MRGPGSMAKPAAHLPKPQRRLVVTTSYPRFAGDSAGCFVANRVDEAVRAGQAVTVVAAGAEPARGDEGLAGVSIRRVPFALAGCPPLFYGDGAPELLEDQPGCAAVQALRFWAGLLETLRGLDARAPGPGWTGRGTAADATGGTFPETGPFAAIESHWLLPSSLAVRAAGLGGRHTAYAHSGDVALLERLPAGQGLARWLVAGRLDVVFASADLERRFVHLLGADAGILRGRSRVEPAQSPLAAALGPGTRRGKADAIAARAGVAVRRGQRPRLLGVGRLVPIKGYDVLVRAVGRLPPAVRPEVVLVGEGPERRRLHQMAQARGVTLELAGQRTPDELAGFFAGADLFVHPCRRLPSGRTEGTPVVIGEALAAGLPVIASASGGVAELAGARLFLVPPDDPGALAQALLRTLAPAGFEHS